MKIQISSVLSGMALLSLTACSAVEWESPGASSENIAFDRQACRSLARAETERVLRRQPISGETRGNIIGNDYDASMARYEMSRQGDKIFVRCMESRGYRRTSKPLF